MKIRVNPNAFEKQLHIKSLEDANDAASKQIMQLKQQNAELEVRSTAKELRMKDLLRTTNLTSTELLLVESENDRYQRQTMELEQQIAELNGAAEEYRNKQVKIERELTRANDLRLQLETQSQQQRGKLQHLNSAIDSSEEQIERLKALHERLRERTSSLTRHIHKRQQQAQTLSNRLQLNA